MTVQVFSVPVFFVVFRETLETVIIVSVLLAFLKQTLDGPNADKRVYRKLVRQVGFLLSKYPFQPLQTPRLKSSTGLVRHCPGPFHLPCHRRCSDRRLLPPRPGQVGQHRVLLGRLVRHRCHSYHLYPRRCAPPRLQDAGEVARQASP